MRKKLRLSLRNSGRERRCAFVLTVVPTAADFDRVGTLSLWKRLYLLSLFDLFLLMREPRDKVFDVALVLDRFQHTPELVDLLPAKLADRFVAHILQFFAARHRSQDAVEDRRVVLWPVVVVREPRLQFFDESGDLLACHLLCSLSVADLIDVFLFTAVV